MDTGSESIHDRLVSLAGIAARTEHAEGRILKRAEARLQEVNERLDMLRPTIELHGDDEYLALVKERAQVERVIAESNRLVSRSR